MNPYTKSLNVLDFIADDAQGLLRTRETRLGYFLRRLILKLRGYGRK